MRKYLCGLMLAALSFAAPASARDHQFYVGIDAGAWVIPDINSKGPDFSGSGFPIPPLLTLSAVTPMAASDPRERVTGSFDIGNDVDLVAGYDFGPFRLEGELSRKRADFDEVTIEGSFIGGFVDGKKDSKGSIRARTAVLNVLFDLQVNRTVSLYAGPGLGYGTLKLTPKVDLFDDGAYGDELRETKHKGAFGQLVGGVRIALTDQIDAGVKYRYIRSEKLRYDAGVLGDLSGRLSTHSILASLTFNFGRPTPASAPRMPEIAAPIAPPSPATQTCADGSESRANDTCPVAPPIAAGERG